VTAESIWTTLGWLGNACFFSRFLLQWALSERARRSVAPPAFWWVSLAGSVLLGAYALHGGHPILLVGFLINGSIYARNLWLQRSHRELSATAMWTVAAGAALLALVAGGREASSDALSPAWIVVGALGQIAWSSRFVVQWIASERARKSIIPAAFWFFSIGGGIVLLIYAIYRRDPVFIAGQALGLVIYSRNIFFILREKRDTVEAK
jgi:lipid-A-disaccharide synthase-like uncharacterized protein